MHWPISKFLLLYQYSLFGQGLCVDFIHCRCINNVADNFIFDKADVKV